MQPRSAKYLRSETVVLGPKERRIELGEDGGAAGEGETTDGDEGSSSLAMSKAVICCIVRREDELEADETALALLEGGMGEAADDWSSSTRWDCPVSQSAEGFIEDRALS